MNRNTFLHKDVSCSQKGEELIKHHCLVFQSSLRLQKSIYLSRERILIKLGQVERNPSTDA